MNCYLKCSQLSECNIIKNPTSTFDIIVYFKKLDKCKLNANFYLNKSKIFSAYKNAQGKFTGVWEEK